LSHNERSIKDRPHKNVTDITNHTAGILSIRCTTPPISIGLISVEKQCDDSNLKVFYGQTQGREITNS
jgi:hypothetical protein